MVATILVVFGLAACTPFGATLNRPSDPLVLDGSALPKLLGSDPMDISGFCLGREGMASSTRTGRPARLREPRSDLPSADVELSTLYGTTTPYKILVYTPPATLTAGYTSSGTYTPPDPDPTFDANDQLSFLVTDTGQQAGASVADPGGVDGSTPVRWSQ